MPCAGPGTRGASPLTESGSIPARRQESRRRRARAPAGRPPCRRRAMPPPSLHAATSPRNVSRSGRFTRRARPLPVHTGKAHPVLVADRATPLTSNRISDHAHSSLTIMLLVVAQHGLAAQGLDAPRQANVRSDDWRVTLTIFGRPGHRASGVEGASRGVRGPLSHRDSPGAAKRKSMQFVRIKGVAYYALPTRTTRHTHPRRSRRA